MGDDSTTLYILAAVCVVAVIGLALSVASFATNETMTGMMGPGGPMMGGGGGTTTASGPGLLEWTVLVLSAAFLALAVVLLIRGRARQPSATPSMPVSTGVPAPILPAPSVSTVSPLMPSPAATPPPVPEPTLVKLLDEDERRMYLELRDHGGAMLQRDLVALGIFSKAKVTRVLDKLENKGLVVREAHGMTNRVRLTPGAAR